MAANIGTLMRSGRRQLDEAGITTAGLDAALLLGAVTGLDRAALIAYPERQLTERQVDGFCDLLRRRAAREPVSRLIGRREFWSLDFEVNRHVLDPRPDSETLVSAALEWLDGKPFARILDLGTGSGCLLLALLHERPGDSGLGVDISQGAIETARRNAGALGLAERAEFACGDWCEGLPDTMFDLVVSNPPYIPTDDIATLEPEVTLHDPRAALEGGPDGLAAYHLLAAQMARILVPGGVAVLEVGAGQSAAVTDLLLDAGAASVNVRCDLSGRVRCLLAVYA